MNKLLPFLFILVISFSCAEEFDISEAQIQEDQKTASVLLNNVPANVKGDSVYIFTLNSENEFYSATQASATEDAVVPTAVPTGKASFSIIVYIPTVQGWTIEDGFAAGWYSSFLGATERGGRYVTNEWDEASSFEQSNQGGASDVIGVELLINGSATLTNNDFQQGEILTLEADVTNNLLSSISSVSFTIDGTVIEEIVEEPYQVNFNTKDVNAGLHLITVSVNNADGDVVTDEMEIIISVEDNEAPTVNITGISNGSTYERQTVRTIVSNVEDANGADDIDRVEFIINGSTVATVTEAPYNYEWDTYDNQVGQVTVEVVAYDQAGAQRSDFVNVELVAPANYAPRVSITSPANGTNITIGSLIDINTSVSDEEGDAIYYVAFYFNGSYIGSDYTAPYTFEDFNTAGYQAGEYTIRARVYDTNYNGSSETIAITLSE